jgi:hypothetical protein
MICPRADPTLPVGPELYIFADAASLCRCGLYSMHALTHAGGVVSCLSISDQCMVEDPANPTKWSVLLGINPGNHGSAVIEGEFPYRSLMAALEITKGFLAMKEYRLIGKDLLAIRWCLSIAVCEDAVCCSWDSAAVRGMQIET